MDWAAGEEGVKGRARLLVAVASMACAIASLLYVLAAAAPLWYFHGYVRGYYSLLNYSLLYAHDGQPVSMPHTDYVRHVVVTFTLLSIVLLVLSPAPILLLRTKPTVASGLAYGVATGLGVLYGLLFGYLYRAVGFDVGRFAFLMDKPNNEVVFETNAGVIVFEGVIIEPTIIQGLVFGSPTLLILLALAVTASSVAAAAALHAAYKPEPRQKGDNLYETLKHGSAYAMLLVLSFSALASVFTYYPSALTVNLQPPPATLETPLYTYTCTSLARTSRVALTYADFETYPLPGWASSGGIWSTVSRVVGAKGNVLRGSDNNGGIGGTSTYYYNTRLDTYSSLWVVAKTRWVSGSGNQYYGVSMVNSPGNRLFTVEIFTTGTTTGYLDMWSYNVVASGWSNHAHVAIPNYNQANWYVIVIYYSVSGTTITISAYLYDVNGNYVTSTSATITYNTVFIPAYLGVSVDYTTTGASLTAYFDDFLISTADPRNIYFTGLQPSMRVEVWDNLGGLVAYGTATGATLTLGVVHDAVIGTGADGRIILKYPDSSACGVFKVPTTDAILGGDAYGLSTRSISWSPGANRTSSSVTVYLSGSETFITTARPLRVSASQTLYARLIIDSVSAPSTLNLDIWLEGVVKSTNATVRNGLPISASTSIVPLNLGGKDPIVLSGYFTATNQLAKLSLKLELCTAPGGRGACVQYPLLLNLASGSLSFTAPSSASTGEAQAEPSGESHSPTGDQTYSEVEVPR